MRKLTMTLAATTLLLAGCSGSGPPGGEAGIDVLEEEGRLDEDGAVSFGPVVPDGIDQASCDYVFGTAEEVADYAGLEGEEFVLVDGSGPAQLGGGGSGLRCGYGVDAADQSHFRLILWTDALDAEVALATVEANGWHAGAGYNPEYDGEETLTEQMATEWLEQAAQRYAGGGI